MYICLCNAITERAVEASIADGCRSPQQIYAACGHAPQCGQCAQTLCDMLDAAQRFKSVAAE